MPDEKQEKGRMSVADAGALAGKKRLAAIGPDGFSQMGKKGGSTTRDRHGPQFYQAIGRAGGQKVARERGPDYYREIGKKGGAKFKELVEKGRAVEEAGG